MPLIFILILSVYSNAEVLITRRNAMLGSVALTLLPRVRLTQASQWKHALLRQDLKSEEAFAVEQLELDFAKNYGVPLEQVAENVDRLRDAYTFHIPARYSSLGPEFEAQFIKALGQTFPSLASSWMARREWLIREGVNQGMRLEGYYPQVSYKSVREWRVQCWRQNPILNGSLDLNSRQKMAEQLTDYEFRFAKFYRLNIERVFENQFYLSNPHLANPDSILFRQRTFAPLSKHLTTVYKNYFSQALPQLFLPKPIVQSLPTPRPLQVIQPIVEIRRERKIWAISQQRTEELTDFCKWLLRRTSSVIVDLNTQPLKIEVEKDLSK